MGTTVSVDSVVYNLAGDEADRPEILKTQVVQNILSGSKKGIGESLIEGALKGPVMKLRSFYRWASKDENYGEVGMPTAALSLHGTLDPSLIEPYITVTAGQVAWASTAEVGYSDLDQWVKQWILINQSGDIDDTWEAVYDEDTGEVTITFSDTSTEVFTPTGYDPEGSYIYAEYQVVSEDTEGTLVTGTEIDVDEENPMPDLLEWTQVSEDAGPPIETTYERQYFVTDVDTGSVYLVQDTLHAFNDAGAISYRIDSKTDLYSVDLSTRIYIYEIGSGSTELDVLASNGATYGEFFPFMPVRINNEFLSATHYPDAYEQVVKAYYKATNGKLSDLINQISDTDSLDDIDHAYLVFGVSLNVLDNSARRYLYTFLKNLMSSQRGGPNAYTNFEEDYDDKSYTIDTWVDWEIRYRYNEDPPPRSPRPDWPNVATNEVRIQGDGGLKSRYNIALQWRFIKEGSGSGLAKTGAKAGDVFCEYIGEDERIRTVIQYGTYAWRYAEDDPSVNYDVIRVYKQISDTEYTYLDVAGLVHRNYVYSTYTVVIGAKAALEDEYESGFIIPLHYDTWKDMSLVDANQMSTACVFIVLNAYQVNKTRWWQTGIFKVFLVIIVAIVSVVLTGGAGLGLLGTHFAVGTYLGFTGLTAAIVGSVANALVAMILMTVLSTFTDSLGVLGQILNVVVMLAIGQISSALQTNGALTINWGNFLKADNLMKLTNAVGNGYAGVMQSDTLKIAENLDDYLIAASRESANIQKAYLSEFGYGNGQIDPLMFTESSDAILAESPDTFLTRTLMSGSEIAEMSQELLYDFSDYSLTLPNAFT